MNLFIRKELLISEKDSLQGLTCGPSQKFSASSEPYEFVFFSEKLNFSRFSLDSIPGEDMDVFKCIVPMRHGSTLNGRRAATSLVRLVEEEKRCKMKRGERGREVRGSLPPGFSSVFSRKIGVESSQIMLSPEMVLKATENSRCTSSL
ncbi:hypothetical protein TNCV_1819921 [Trichonephila clavipes]|nr:hypothetical protein TNCV_1819921 [Trichonephila clavipes]